MDPITHTLAGIGTANAFFRQRGGNRVVLVLAVASLAPDVDALVHLNGDSTSILMRRTFGHSIFTIPLWSLLLATFFRWLYPDLRFLFLYSLAILGMGLHLFLDSVNSFGVVFLWPFNDWRPELAIIFIIDLVFTALLIFPLLFSLSKKMRPHLTFLSKISLSCLFVYIMFCGLMRFQAISILKTEITRSGGQPDFFYVFPEPFGPHRWKGVLQENDTYRVFLIHPLLDQIHLKKEIQTNESNPLIKKIRSTPLAQKIDWFFKAPVWTLEMNREGFLESGEAKASVYDIRFESLLIKRNIPFVYEFVIHPDGEVERKS